MVLIHATTNGSDPCDPSNYSNAQCVGDSGSSFSLQLSNLMDNQEYLLIVGSNHDAAYGPCPFTVETSGEALSLVAGVNPLRINLGDSAQLSVDGQDPNTDMSWTPAEFLDDPNSATPTAIPEETTVFTVTGYVGGYGNRLCGRLRGNRYDNRNCGATFGNLQYVYSK